MLSLLRDAARLPALAADWAALWQRAGRPPFQSPAWLLPWWDAFGTAEPLVATLRDAAGTLRGLLPLYLLNEPGARKLLPFGVGVSDRIDALLDPAAPPDAAATLLHASLRAAAAAGASECWLPDLPETASLRPVPPPPGWDATDQPAAPCPTLRLRATLRGSLPAGRLRDLRQAAHRAARLGGWTAQCVDDPVAGWQDFMALHRARWTARGRPDGVLADPRVRAFHAAAIPRLAACGLLRLYALRIAGRPAAAYYVLRHGARLLFHLSGLDPAFAHASPGTLLLGYIAERAIAEGMTELDFLRGAESYKYAWGAVDRPGTSRALRPNPLGLALVGRLPPGVALARMALAGDVPPLPDDAPPALARLAARARALAPMLAEAGRGHTPSASVADIAALFDRAARWSPEASVAAWSLGDPALLDEATQELVGWLARERLVWPGAAAVDLGCGVGRVTVALARRGLRVRGLDVSATMIAEARARHPALDFAITDGIALPLAPDSCDLVLAVDVMPYVVQSGVAAAVLQQAARAVRPGGAVAIFNLSYRPEPEADRRDATDWARRHGLSLVQAGATPFRLWDGAAWVLRRARVGPSRREQRGLW